MSSSPAEIHLLLVGGLGNQLFQVSASLALTNGPIYLYDHLSNTRKNSDALPEILDFDLPSRVIFVNQNLKSTNFRRILNLCLRSSTGKSVMLSYLFQRRGIQYVVGKYISKEIKKKVTLIISTNLGYFERNFDGEPVYLIGYFQSYRWVDSMAILKAEKPLSLKVESDACDFAKLHSKNRVLAVHVRLTDYRNDNSIGVINKGYYLKILREIYSRYQVDEIWLFSDDPKEAESRIPFEFGDILRVVPKMSSAATLLLMSEADYFVLANSTFSWWGAFMSRSSNQVVYAPKIWFKNLDSPLDLIPPTWNTRNNLFE